MYTPSIASLNILDMSLYFNECGLLSPSEGWLPLRALAGRSLPWRVSRTLTWSFSVRKRPRLYQTMVGDLGFCFPLVHLHHVAIVEVVERWSTKLLWGATNHPWWHPSLVWFHCHRCWCWCCLVSPLWNGDYDTKVSDELCVVRVCFTRLHGGHQLFLW